MLYSSSMHIKHRITIISSHSIAHMEISCNRLTKRKRSRNLKPKISFNKLFKDMSIWARNLFFIVIWSQLIFLGMAISGKLVILVSQWFVEESHFLIKLMLVLLYICHLNPWKRISTLRSQIFLQLELYFLKW